MDLSGIPGLGGVPPENYFALSVGPNSPAEPCLEDALKRRFPESKTATAVDGAAADRAAPGREKSGGRQEAVPPNFSCSYKRTKPKTQSRSEYSFQRTPLAGKGSGGKVEPQTDAAERTVSKETMAVTMSDHPRPGNPPAPRRVRERSRTRTTTVARRAVAQEPKKGHGSTPIADP